MTSNGQVLGEALRDEGTIGWFVIVKYPNGRVGSWKHDEDNLWYDQGREGVEQGMTFDQLNNWLGLWSVTVKSPAGGAKIGAIYDSEGNQIA